MMYGLIMFVYVGIIIIKDDNYKSYIDNWDYLILYLLIVIGSIICLLIFYKYKTKYFIHLKIVALILTVLN